MVTPSWGGPHAFPKVYQAGLDVLRNKFGLEIKEMGHVRASQSYLRRNPQSRAADVNDAFLDPEVNAIIASVGGCDSVRILPYLDVEAALEHPKVLMGFSDTTTLLAHLCCRGMVTFYGPSVLAGISQLPNYPRAMEHFRDMLFRPSPTYDYRPYPRYSEGYPDWSDDSRVGKINRKRRNTGWKVLQSNGAVEGELFGGCIEVLEMMKSTRFFPPVERWAGKVLFLETSEEKPTPEAVQNMLRNYGMIGALDDLSALLLARPRGYSREEKRRLERKVLEVVAGEFGRSDMPIIADMDFGHTDPQLILPLGARVAVDSNAPSVRLLEPAVR